MTAMANPDLSDIDAITMRRLRIMSSLSIGIFGLIGIGFLRLRELRVDELFSQVTQLRRRQHRHGRVAAGCRGLARC